MSSPASTSDDLSSHNTTPTVPANVPLPRTRDSSTTRSDQSSTKQPTPVETNFSPTLSSHPTTTPSSSSITSSSIQGDSTSRPASLAPPSSSSQHSRTTQSQPSSPSRPMSRAPTSPSNTLNSARSSLAAGAVGLSGRHSTAFSDGPHQAEPVTSQSDESRLGQQGSNTGDDAHHPSAIAPPPSSFHARPQQGSLSRRSSAMGNLTSPAARPRSASRTNTRRIAHDADDDEFSALDRGEELIRKRNRERKVAARASNYDTGGCSTPVGGGGGGSNRSRARESIYSTGLTTPNLQTAHSIDQGGYFGSLASPAQLRPHSIADRSAYAESVSGSVDGDGESHAGDGLERRNSVLTVQEAGEMSTAGSSIQEEDQSARNGGDSTEGEEEKSEAEETDEDDDGNLEVTLKDRQDAINAEHPFGLPIWKPALYKKSRTVTRDAETALHSIPSAAAQRHLLPGNLLWTIFFGWWLSLVCCILAALIWLAEGGGGRYSSLVAGLAWYLVWPFGRYVEGEGIIEIHDEDDEEDEGREDEHVRQGRRREPSDSGQSSTGTIKPYAPLTPSAEEENDVVPPLASSRRQPSEERPAHERDSLLGRSRSADRPRSSVGFASNGNGDAKGKAKHAGLSRSQSYGATNSGGFKYLSSSAAEFQKPTVSFMLGSVAYWISLVLVIAPLMIAVCALCWGLVVSIPMAKLTWELLVHLFTRPLALGFRHAPKVVVPAAGEDPGAGGQEGNVATNRTSPASDGSDPAVKRTPFLRPGQASPRAGPRSTVLLCTYRAVGMQYFKYTVGGVNIIFVDLMPLVFFVIFDGWFLLPYSEHRDLGPFWNFITSQVVVFVMALASVIPLSYFIGMAVASISAQSSIGTGAVINATFGSVIEIVLYAIALTQGKGRLVEGSIVGSLLAGVLLMPGVSMVSGALKRKEQKFNAKSAGVTSTMLIMAIIGILTPTLFYQAYGSFELSCTGCPSDSTPNPNPSGNQPWMCKSCRYSHPDPAGDPFYQEKVKHLMYFCAFILTFSYLIGLWFSLRTHASQIWSNPQQLLHPEPLNTAGLHPAHRASIHARQPPAGALSRQATDLALPTSVKQTPPPLASYAGAVKRNSVLQSSNSQTNLGVASARPSPSRKQSHDVNAPPLTPFVESIVRGQQQQKGGSQMENLELPAGALDSEAFTKAVTAATVTALRHQQSLKPAAPRPYSGLVPAMAAPAAAPVHHQPHEEGAGGHEGPEWSRFTSGAVLCGCTVLYSIIAEILVDVVDSILEGTGFDEKLLGVVLFAVVPNATEFMNACSFALNGNIALSMEIGSAYALQVCLLQIPAMVAFSAFYDPQRFGEAVDTFTLIFPQYDVIVITFSIFLCTYTYIEARSNYHRGSILILAYLVLVAGFWFAPPHEEQEESWPLVGDFLNISAVPSAFSALTTNSHAMMDPLSMMEKIRAVVRGLWA